MLINGRPFTVSTERFDTIRRMRASAGNSPLLPEFRPVRFPHDAIIWQLLYNCFYCQDMLLSRGTVCTLHGGCFRDYNTASLFIAMTDSAFLRLIFRQHPDPLDNFYIHGFLFVFLEADDEDIYYDISCGEFNMTFAFAKIETTGNCNPFSNLDFVHFIWTNYERFTFGKYCLTFIPRNEPDLPGVVCVKHHRAESEGWRNDIHCPRVSPGFKPIYVAWPAVNVPTSVPVPSACGTLPPYSLPHPTHSF